MRSFKSNENIHKKEGGSYYVVSASLFQYRISINDRYLGEHLGEILRHF